MKYNNCLKFIKSVFSIFFLLLLIGTSTAQNTVPPLGEVFKDDVVPRIDVFIDQDSLDMLLDPDNLESDYHYNITMMFDNGTVRDTFEDVGFRLRGNTSRQAAKKSVKFSFNTYVPGRKYEGLEKLNVNGEHNDPSIMRSKLCWDMLRAIEIPAPRCNHVDVYLNEDYVGVFANVEHIDEEFVKSRFGNNGGNLYKCLFPATLEFMGTDPNLYKQEVFGRRPYDLKTNVEEDDYSDLAQFIHILNNTSSESMPCELEKVFHVDNYLKVIAFDILTSNWDGPIYNKNNFYLYHNQATGQFEYIPFDVDNTLGIDWFISDLAQRDIYNWSPSGQPRPIYTQLMEVPLYRKRFSYYMQQMIEQFFNVDNLNPYLDERKALIDASVMDDPLYPLDYGFSFGDYETSFVDDLGGHVRYGMKPYISERAASALAQLELENIEPIIKNTATNRPLLNEDIIITTAVEDDGAVANVQLCYQLNDSAEITCIDMFDNGQQEDGEANDGVYGIQLMGYDENTDFHYYIVATDDTNLSLQRPYCGFNTISIGRNGLELYINELMASNDATIADEAGEFDDWLEIYNGSNEAIFLGDKFLTDDMTRPDKWKFPDITLEAGDFLLIWADEDQEQGDFHTNFKLSAGGEEVGLFIATSDGFEMIDGLTFDEQTTDVAWGRLPNGLGDFQTLSPTPGMSNMPVSVETIQNKIPEILVYPNPATEEVKIELTEKVGANLEVKISNALGQLVFEGQLMDGKGSTLVWGRKGLEAGIYFVSFYKEGILLETQEVLLQGF